MPSFAKPTNRQLDSAIPLISSPQHEAHFFSQLENPHWIEPLRERGIFNHPPRSEQVGSGGVRFPIWPPSQYLARMAAHLPDEVALIFAGMETDNLSIVGDMLQGALTMPASAASTLTPKISHAAENGTLWVHFKDACDLCVHLAKGGEAKAALTLADALFTPHFKPGHEQPRHRDQYWYKAGLDKVIPVLVAREPGVLLRKMCDWLRRSIDATKRVERDSGADGSYWWRPAIEQHAQNLRDDFASAMVGFLRMGLEQAIRKRAISLGDALEIVDGYSYLVFRRLRIHLINEFAEQAPELARQIMMDRSVFDDFRYKHEYAKLVGRRLDMLTPDERGEWFAWVDAGPDMRDFDESARERLGREPTDSDRTNRKEYWQFEKLHCVRKHLDGERRIFYEAMHVKHGEPELAKFNTYVSAGAWGSISPMKVEDLDVLAFPEAVEKVASWKPEARRFLGPDTEGLANTFREYVDANPEAFSAQADALIGRPANYVRVFLTQMAEAVKVGKQLDFASLFRLCRWVLDQPVAKRTTLQEEAGALVDPDWQWTRDEISRLVKNICEAKADDAPKYTMEGLREELWHIVETLYRDPSRSNIVHDPSEDDPRLRDYLTLGINSPRGKALEAGLEYARWVANHIKTPDGEHAIVPDGFAAMPEVREMLEWQISKENRSFEALAIIGLHLGLIYWIDKEWLATNADRLFYLEGLKEEPALPHGWAAWNALLVWARPHIEFYRLFKKQFAYAVAEATRLELAEQSREQPMNHLGEHLITLYVRGQLGLDDDEHLLRRFLNDANPDIRRHTIGFVGRSIKDDQPLPDEFVARFRELWEMYWAGPGKKDAEQKPDAWLFGMWFASRQFPDAWALERLEAFVEVVPTPEPDHMVVERLAEIGITDIARTTRILDRMVRGDREGWRMHGWLKPARQILDVAMKSGGDARRLAEQTIDYLGRRGHTEFGELLDT